MSDSPSWILRRPGDPGFITIGREAYRNGDLVLSEWCDRIRLHAAIIQAGQQPRARTGWVRTTKRRLTQNEGWPPPGF